jgi:thiamine biosynthesis lipoprotein ApbE
MKIVRCITVVVTLILLPGDVFATVKRSWPVMGTFAEVTLDTKSSDRAGEAIESVRDVFERINRTMSVYRAQSDLMQVNRWAGHRAITVDPWVADLVRKGRRAHIATSGAFSMDVLAAGIARGLKPNLVNAGAPGGRDRFVKIFTVPPMIYLPGSSIALDLGGIAKGYALDRAREALQRHGYNRFLINLGRNVSVGAPPETSKGWPVRIADTDRVRHLKTVTVSVSQQGIRSDTAHVIGPGERRSPSAQRKVVVAATNGWVADMASTALLVDPSLVDRLKRTYESIAWIMIRNNSS